MAYAGSIEVPLGAQAASRGLHRPVTLRICGTHAGSQRDFVVHDISATGLLVDADAQFGPNTAVEVELPGIGLCGTHVAWTGERFSGLSFDCPMTGAASAALAQCAIAQTEFCDDRLLATDCDAPGPDKLPYGVRLAVISGLAAACWVPFIALGWALFA